MTLVKETKLLRRKGVMCPKSGNKLFSWEMRPLSHRVSAVESFLTLLFLLIYGNLMQL